MNICVVENKAKVQIQDNENIFSLGFFSSDKTFLISENSETVAFKLFKNAEVSINSQLDKLEINFTKAAKYLQFITFELNVESIFDIEKDYLRFSAGDGIYVLDFINTSFSFDSSSNELAQSFRYVLNHVSNGIPKPILGLSIISFGMNSYSSSFKINFPLFLLTRYSFGKLHANSKIL